VLADNSGLSLRKSLINEKENEEIGLCVSQRSGFA
jgi:hypothetical protein